MTIDLNMITVSLIENDHIVNWLSGWKPEPPTWTPDQVYQHVDQGIAFLNERLPGWRDLIDLDILDLSETTACVLGQVSERLTNGAAYDYSGALTWIERVVLGRPRRTLDDTHLERGEWARSHGFLGVVSEDEAMLTCAWIDRILNPVR